MTATDLLANTLERALNAYLRQDSDASARIAALEHKVMALEITGLDLVLFLCVVEGGISVRGQFDGTPDTILRGTPLALTRLALTSEPTRSLAAGEVEVEGDSQVGEAYRRLFGEVEIDWEEALSKWIGDIPAHQMGSWARSMRAWARRSLDSLRMDLTEYLQEESEALPTRVEIEYFLMEVDTLRSDVDRLEARIRRLEQKRGEARDRKDG